MSKPPRNRHLAIHISDNEAGSPLLQFLGQRFTYLSLDQWRQELAQGRLLLNGVASPRPETQLTRGDCLTYHPTPFPEPPVDFSCTVVHEDDCLLVIDKSGSLPCHPAGRYFNHTLWAVLKERFGLAKPSIINRLDRETSGLVLVAKTQKAARYCSRQFAERTVKKRYHVLVEGEIPWSSMIAEGYLQADSRSVIRKKMRFVPEAHCANLPKGAVSCRTEFHQLGSGNGLTLVEARPVSGRCHQIRASLASLGYPVVGDKIYGVDENFFLKFINDQLSPEDKQRLRLAHQALHCLSLAILHPADQKPILFTSDTPDFHDLL